MSRLSRLFPLPRRGRERVRSDAQEHGRRVPDSLAVLLGVGVALLIILLVLALTAALK